MSQNLGLMRGRSFGLGLGPSLYGLAAAASAITYLFRSALNASRTNPLESLTGSNVQQVATGSVVIPDSTGTLITLPAGYPAVPGATYSWDTADGATLGSDLRDSLDSLGANLTESPEGIFTSTSPATSNLNRLLISLLSGQATENIEISFTVVVGGSIDYWTGSAYSAVIPVTPGDYSFRSVPSGADAFIHIIAAGTKLSNLTVKNITPAVLAPGLGEVATVLESGLTRYTGFGGGNPSGGVLVEPSGTSAAFNSRDLTGWTAVQTPVVTYDQTGITGGANTATYLEDNTSSFTEFVYKVFSGYTSGQQDSANLYIAYKNDETYFPAFRIGFTVGAGTSGTDPRARWLINQKTGAIFNELSESGVSGIGATSKREGDFWKVTITANDGGTSKTHTVLDVYPALSSDFSTQSVTPVGSCIVGNVELYRNTSLAAASASTPIFTTTAAITRPPRYEKILGAEIGQKLRFDLVSKEALSASGRTTTLFDDLVRKVKYNNGLLVFRDESQVMGGELVTNGTFDVDSNWTKGANWTISGGKLNATNTAIDTISYQVFATTIGKTYLATLDTTIASGLFNAWYFDNIAVAFKTLKALAAGPNSFAFTAVSNQSRIVIYSAANGSNGTFDNISIKEVAELTYPVTLNADTIYQVGIDMGTAASMSIDGTEVATATFPAASQFSGTTFVGSKVVSGTASETLNGTITVIQSSNDIDAGAID